MMLGGILTVPIKNIKYLPFFLDLIQQNHQSNFPFHFKEWISERISTTPESTFLEGLQITVLITAFLKEK